MKLVDSSNNAVVLAEGDARIVNWDKFLSLVYHTYAIENNEPKDVSMTVIKLIGLEGYKLITDGGTEIVIPEKGDLNNEDYALKIAKLLVENGISTGVDYSNMESFFRDVIPSAVKTYKERDTNDENNINVTLLTNLPNGVTVEGVGESIDLKFPRSVNAVLVKDILDKVSNLNSVQGYIVVGVSSDENPSVSNILYPNDKILEDVTLSLVWEQDVTIVVTKKVSSDNGETFVASGDGVEITVPYNATVEDAIREAQQNDSSKALFVAGEGETFSAITNVEGVIITTNKQLKKAAAALAGIEVRFLSES